MVAVITFLVFPALGMVGNSMVACSDKPGAMLSAGDFLVTENLINQGQETLVLLLGCAKM